MGKISSGEAIILVFVVLLVLSCAFIEDVKAFFLELASQISISLMSVFGGENGFNIPPPEGQPPADKPDCTYYDFNFEFNKYFGLANMQYLGQSCGALGGIWTSDNDEVSCRVPPTFMIDCNADGYDYFESFCENGALTNNMGVKGKYYCDNLRHYVGCICPITTNPPAIPPQDEDQDGYTCGWYDVNWGQECGGTCPTGTECMVLYDVCKCWEHEEEWQLGGIGTVFVTSLKWSGAMGGLSEMDSKCQTQAQFAGLSGTWKAIAGDTTTNPKDRVPDMAYYLLNGNLIANNKADLFDGSIQTAINVDENGNKVSASAVWTNSYADGTRWSNSLTNTCHDWGWTSEGYIGGTGTTDANNNFWINTGNGQACSLSARIYCIRVS